MTKASLQKQLTALWGEVHDLNAAEELLGWDQETYMPPQGVEGRGKLLSTLAGIKHAKLTDSRLKDTLEACAEAAEPGSELSAQAREGLRQVNRACLVPADLAKKLAEARSLGLASWQQARKDNDFSGFEANLERIVALKQEEGAALAMGGRPYDALMDEFDPGATEAAIAPLFQRLREHLSPLVKAVQESGRVIDESPVQGNFPVEQQIAFSRRVAEKIGFDFSAGRMDPTAHPFCSGFNPKDVRITWRAQDDDLRPALYGIMHEAGHGTYEQGLPLQWQRTPIGPAVSLGVHESQSRLWENLVGRSRAFWQWALPLYHEHFPDKAGVTVDQIWPALHTVKPSFIRVEADEGAYNLHILVRFEIERALFAGQVTVKELPGLWDDTYEELLGIRPSGPAQGVLQDIHWAMGAFGYFHTYTMGNLINAQLFVAARKELGDLEAQFARGEFQPLLDWLREKVHGHGSRYPAAELIERATGRPLGPEDFLDYITETTQEVYSISMSPA